MKNLVIALSSLALFLSSVSLQADSLRDIYELALENDAQLKSEEAVYLARRETENLSRSALLPQVGASYSYQKLRAAMRMASASEAPEVMTRL